MENLDSRLRRKENGRRLLRHRDPFYNFLYVAEELLMGFVLNILKAESPA